MSVIASICSFNDTTSVMRCADALLGQSHPVDHILIVDNRSSNGNSGTSVPSGTSLICNLRNLGPTGAAATAIEYALERGYEWLWILDQDSVPNHDALEQLVALYASLPAEVQGQVGALTTRMIRKPDGQPEDYGLLTRRGPRPVRIVPSQTYYECDSAVWSGSLFRLDAVERVGLPSYGAAGYWDGLNIDWGDVEYFFRLRQKGYKVLVHRSSFIRHRLGGEPRELSLFGLRLRSTNHPAFRRYLYLRNMTYFWLYLYPNRKLLPILCHLSARCAAAVAKILLLEENRAAKLSACAQGVWDGVFKKIHRRF
jgi:rhamnosyltransferase